MQKSSTKRVSTSKVELAFYKYNGEHALTSLGEFCLTGKQTPAMHVPSIGDVVHYSMHDEAMSFAGQVRGRSITYSSVDNKGAHWGLCTRIVVILDTHPTKPTTLGDSPATAALQ